MPLFLKRSNGLGKSRRRDMPDGLWLKCPECNEMLYSEELDKALRVCPLCNYHFPLDRADRIAMLADDGTFEEWDRDLLSLDFLGFIGPAPYQDKLEDNRRKTGQPDAVTCGRARLDGRSLALGVMDFNFLGASMGSVVGEKITRLIERATAAALPLVIVCASGGARMYEGLLSLMQMAKTSGALARHADAGLPYISVLTHPTTAGVMASFATLGDVILAEPGALIGFAGARVIKETIQQDLPAGFQRPDFLLKHGLLDQIVPRRELKARLALLLDYLMPAPAAPAPATAPV